MSKNKPKKKRSAGRVLLRVLLIMILLAALVCVGLGIYFGPKLMAYNAQAKKAVSESTEETFRPSETGYIYDADGQLITTLKGAGSSEYLSYDQIPQTAVDAFVAVEDRTFWTNHGIDLKGLVRVGVNYVLSRGQEKHGASTITQQLVKNTFLTQEVTMKRKIQEFFYAWYVNRKYSKKEIMEFYINNIYFANGYYGLESAAQGYFSKSAGELSLSELVYLCAIPNRPNYYDPIANPDNALSRRNKILKDMRNMGTITQSEYDEALSQKITLNRQSNDSNYNDYAATYATDCAIRMLMKNAGFQFQYHFDTDTAYENYLASYDEAFNKASQELYTRGYKVYTSLDMKKQETLQEAVNTALSFDGEKKDDGIYALQGAATVIDNETGKVVAICGGRSQDSLSRHSLNRAYQSYRQPGSTMKPVIVYTPALQSDASSKSDTTYSANTDLQDINVTKAKENNSQISSLTGTHYSFRDAVAQSKNGCALQVFYDIGVDYGLSFLDKLHFTKIVPDDETIVSALGGLTYGVSTVEMAGAYAAIANLGEYRETTCITSIKNAQNEELYSDYCSQVYEKSASAKMIDILHSVMTEGTGRRMGWTLDTEVIGKTGTTNDSKDGWFCGATPYYTIAVWVGYDTPRGLDSLMGGSYPAQIWKSAMTNYVSALPTKEFDISDYLDSSENGDSTESESESSSVLDDSTLLAQVRTIASEMLSLDPSSASFDSELSALYAQGSNLAASITGSALQATASEILDSAYNRMKDRGSHSQETDPAESSSEPTQAPTNAPEPTKPVETTAADHHDETTKPTSETKRETHESHENTKPEPDNNAGSE